MSNKEKQQQIPKEIQDKMAKRDKQYHELKDNMIRLQADFENYQKHVDKEKDKFIKTANQALMKDLLETIDGIESAIAIAEKQDPKTVEGLKIIHSNLMKTLGKHGLEPIKALGEKFDPYYHEAVMQEKTDAKEDTILEELQKGYTLNMNVLRHSKVKIAR